MGSKPPPPHPHPTPTPPQPEVGSFRYHGCYDFVRTDQRGWDLLDFLDLMFVRMLHVYKEYGRYYGPHPPPRNPPPTPPQPEVGSFRYHGCYDFVRTDQTGWDLLDFLDVMFVRMLHVYKEYGRYYGPHPPPRNPPHPTPTPPHSMCVVDAFSLCAPDLLLDFLDAMTLYALTRGGGIF